MKSSDRVTWLRSPGRSFLTGWRRQQIPGVIVRVCKRRIWQKILHSGTERPVKVSPENVICDEDGC